MVPTSLIMIRLPRDNPIYPSYLQGDRKAGEAGPGASGRERGRFLRNTGAGRGSPELALITRGELIIRGIIVSIFLSTRRLSAALSESSGGRGYFQAVTPFGIEAGAAPPLWDPPIYNEIAPLKLVPTFRP